MTKRLLTLALLAGACAFAGCGESEDCAITGTGAKLCGDADISAFCEATEPAREAQRQYELELVRNSGVGDDPVMPDDTNSAC